MNISEIISIVTSVLTIVATLVGYYFSIKQKLTDAVNSKIDEAEVDELAGKEKMNYVVDELYKLVPVTYRAIFNKDILKQLVQKAFDKMESYAEKQIIKKVGN